MARVVRSNYETKEIKTKVYDGASHSFIACYVIAEVLMVGGMWGLQARSPVLRVSESGSRCSSRR